MGGQRGQSPHLEAGCEGCSSPHIPSSFCKVCYSFSSEPLESTTPHAFQYSFPPLTATSLFLRLSFSCIFKFWWSLVICPQLSWPTSFCSFSLGNPIYSQGFNYISMALGAPYPSTSQSSIRHYSSNSTLPSVKSFLTSSPCPHKSTPCPTYPVSEWYCHAPRISSQEMRYPWFSSAHHFSLTLCLQLTSLHTTSFFTLQQD